MKVDFNASFNRMLRQKELKKKRCRTCVGDKDLQSLAVPFLRIKPEVVTMPSTHLVSPPRGAAVYDPVADAIPRPGRRIKR